MTKLKWVAKKMVYCQDCLSASPCLSQKSHWLASPLRHSVDEESWRLHPAGPVSHCYECKAASPFPDLWLSAVKAVTILHTAVQYKHFPFSPVPWRVYDVWNQGIRFLFRRLKKNHTRWVIGVVCGRSDHRTGEIHGSLQMDASWPRGPARRRRRDSPKSSEALPAVCREQ